MPIPHPHPAFPKPLHHVSTGPELQSLLCQTWSGGVLLSDVAVLACSELHNESACARRADSQVLAERVGCYWPASLGSVVLIDDAGLGEQLRRWARDVADG